MQVTGNLELSGKLTVTAGTGFGAGLYPLFHYQGGLSGSGLSAGSLPGGYTYSLVVSNAGQVVLAVSKSEVPPSPVTLVLPTIGTDGMEFSFLAESGRSLGPPTPIPGDCRSNGTSPSRRPTGSRRNPPCRTARCWRRREDRWWTRWPRLDRLRNVPPVVRRFLPRRAAAMPRPLPGK